MSQDFGQTIQEGYRFPGPALEVGRAIRGGKVVSEVPVAVPFAMINRHGLVAGATGTGKTNTLQRMAGKLSDGGVPVFLADLNGELSGISNGEVASQTVPARCKELGASFVPQ